MTGHGVVNPPMNATRFANYDESAGVALNEVKREIEHRKNSERSPSILLLDSLLIGSHSFSIISHADTI